MSFAILHDAPVLPRAWVVVAVIAAAFAVGSVLWLWFANAVKRGVKETGKLRRADLAVLAVAFAFSILYGGSKARKGTITYPYTDASTRYLTDNGSFVSNDYVRVNFTRALAPDTADFHLDRRLLSSTNDADWVSHFVTTFAALSLPTNVPFAAATNWNWVGYTTWTPGPAVHTNGVWVSWWGNDVRTNGFIIPVRTAVRVDGETIATPKSKENAQ